MATIESAVTFTVNASDGTTSEDLVAIPLTIVLTEVREPIYIQIKEIIGN